MTSPRWRTDHELLAAVARRLYDLRRDTNRALVEAGKLDRDVALDGIRVMRTIAADWKALAAVAPAPEWLISPAQGGAYPFERIDALKSASIIARTAADGAPDDFEIVGFADAVDTLLWWETARPSARWLIDTTIALRADARAARLAASPAGQPSLFGVAA